MLGMASRRRAQAGERVLVQEAHGDVERRAAPHFQAEQIVQAVGHEVGDGQHVVGADARGQQRLVGVAEGGVGEEQALLRRDPFGEAFGAAASSSSWRVPSGGAAGIVRRRRRGCPMRRGHAACRPLRDCR